MNFNGHPSIASAFMITELILTGHANATNFFVETRFIRVKKCIPVGLKLYKCETLNCFLWRSWVVLKSRSVNHKLSYDLVHITG